MKPASFVMAIGLCLETLAVFAVSAEWNLGITLWLTSFGSGLLGLGVGHSMGDKESRRDREKA